MPVDRINSPRQAHGKTQPQNRFGAMPPTSRGRRSRDAAPPTEDDLIAWYEAGELVERAGRYFDLADPDQFRNAGRLAGELGAAGKIDLLSLVENGAVAAVERHAFFTVVQFYVEAIPSLVEATSRMLAAVDGLVKLGGADGAAGWPNDALLAWLRKDLTRAEEIIVGAGGGNPLIDAHLTFALQVVGDAARARAFLSSPDPMLKASAFTALARMPDPDPVSRAASIEAMGPAVDDGANEMLCANAVASILSVASQEPFADADLVLAAVAVPLAGRAGGTLFRAAAALWSDKAATRPEIAPVLLDALLDLNPEHKGTIDTLDMGLKKLLDAGQDQIVLQFVADLLIKDRGQLKAKAFDSVWRDIVAGDQPRLSRWIVTWLLAGETALGFAVSEVLANLDRDEAGLTVDRAALPTDAVELSYLSRKAVGWFMLQPHLATSLLVAILGICDDPTARDVAGLLADPVLRNYPSMRDALEALPADDKAKPWVDAALAENTRYLEALQRMPDIPELTPSDQHRRIQHLRQADMMQEAHKSAREQSVFFSLVHHSTLLYGNRSLTFVEDFDGGPRRPMEMALGSHSFSMTIPRLEMLDPIGLHLMMINLRGEPRPR